MTNLKQLLIACLLSIMAVSSANAVLMMRVSDGITTMNAVDTDGDGMLNLGGALGSWNITFNTGLGNPYIGNEYVDKMHLNSFNVSGGVGNLTIMLTDVDFTGSNYQINVGGTSQGTLAFAAYADLLNTEFGLTDELFSEAFGVGAFSGSSSGNDLGGLYAITLVANISHTGAGQISSFDFDVKIPEPGQLALMGLALLLIGSVAGKKRGS